MKEKLLSENTIGGSIAILLGAYSISEAVRLYPRAVSFFIGDHFFPGAVGTMMILLGFALIFLKKTPPIRASYPEPKMILRTVLMFLALFANWWLLPHLGYVISSFLTAVVMAWIMGIRHIGKNLLFSVLVTVALYLIFILWLGMPFPRGIFGF